MHPGSTRSASVRSQQRGLMQNPNEPRYRCDAFGHINYDAHLCCFTLPHGVLHVNAAAQACSAAVNLAASLWWLRVSGPEQSSAGSLPPSGMLASMPGLGLSVASDCQAKLSQLVATQGCTLGGYFRVVGEYEI